MKMNLDRSANYEFKIPNPMIYDNMFICRCPSCSQNMQYVFRSETKFAKRMKEFTKQE